MMKIDLSAMEKMWKEMIVQNKMAIEATLCNPRSSLHGSRGYLRTVLLTPGITDRYDVKFYELTHSKAFTAGRPEPKDWVYCLQIMYNDVKNQSHNLFDIVVPQMTFKEFKFTLTEDYNIICEIICDYSKGDTAAEWDRDRFVFSLSHIGDEVLEGIKATAKNYSSKYPYVKWHASFVYPLGTSA
jgi:hypothetical protein